jgi:DNA-binding MarR family transcriptional regulator
MTTDDAKLLRLFSLLQHVLTKVGVQGSKAGREVDITNLQASILDIIVRNNNITMTELSRKGLIVKSAATRIADELVKRGLIKRVNNDNDRRITQLRPTLKGRKVINRVRSEGMTYLRALMINMDPGQQESLLNGLESFVNAVVTAKLETLQTCQDKECIQLKKLVSQQIPDHLKRDARLITVIEQSNAAGKLKP